MMLTVTPAPITHISLPIPREKILEAVMVFRTREGVEVAGDLSDRERNVNLLLDGITRLQALTPPAASHPAPEDAERV